MKEACITMSNLDIESELKSIIDEYKKSTLRPVIEKALDKAADHLARVLKEASPVGDDTQHFRDGWAVKRNYRGVRYVGNTKTVPYSEGNRGLRDIPLSSVLEYSPSSKHKGFINRTVNRNAETVTEVFVNELNKGV